MEVTSDHRILRRFWRLSLLAVRLKYHHQILTHSIHLPPKSRLIHCSLLLKSNYPAQIQLLLRQVSLSLSMLPTSLNLLCLIQTYKKSHNPAVHLLTFVVSILASLQIRNPLTSYTSMKLSFPTLSILMMPCLKSGKKLWLAWQTLLVAPQL